MCVCFLVFHVDIWSLSSNFHKHQMALADCRHQFFDSDECRPCIENSPGTNPRNNVLQLVGMDNKKRVATVREFHRCEAVSSQEKQLGWWCHKSMSTAGLESVWLFRGGYIALWNQMRNRNPFSNWHPKSMGCFFMTIPIGDISMTTMKNHLGKLE